MDISDPTTLMGIIAAFIVYFIAMLAVGFFFMNKNKTASEYMLGGRKLHYFVSAMSAEASDMSGWLLLGLPGVAYLTGLSSAGWTAIGLAIGTYLNWKLVAKRLRVYTHKAKDSITIPEFFRNRFGDKKGITSAISSIFIIVFFVVYTASQFAAGGKLFHSIFGIDYTVAMLIGAAIVVIYTFVGGFRAVCLTDTIQACLMFFALILVPIVALVLLGGEGAGLSSIDPGMFNLFMEYNAESQVFEFVSVFTIVSGLAWAFGYFGQPHILPRFMGIENPEEIPRARRIAMVWVVISMAAAIFIGLVGQVFFGPNGIMPTLADSETVFIDMTTNTLGIIPFIAGIVYCGILGAIMSTASSQMLAASSSISQDLFKAIFKKDATDRAVLLVSKISVLVVAAAAFTIALDPNSSVFGIVSFAWAGFGASFGSIILVGLFWKRMNWQGALAGVLGGGITTCLWYFIAEQMFGNPLYEMVPGVIVSLLCIFIVTKLTTPPAKEVTDVFDEYVKEIGNKGT
ncbi:MAG TPA: sodium/proline symporter PutP [Methanocorpusculum sp.]|nr:sodium/proline symporter PutP [Methanocorpusculum sp.]